MIYVERPAAALFEVLIAKGVFKLGFKPFYELRKVNDLGFQYVAVEILVNEYNVVYNPSFLGRVVRDEDYRGIKFKLLLKDRDFKCDGVVSRKTPHQKTLITWKEVAELLPTPPLPLFVIDVGMSLAQGAQDLSFIKVQLEESMEKIREYLWDPHLAISSSDRSIAEWFHSVAGKNKVIITPSKPSELLWSMDADKVVIIRQDAPHPITPNDILSSDAFLIGVAQDGITKPAMGRMIDSLVPWGIPRRIELKGSIVGVPNSINKVIEIILKARYRYGGDIEKAIIASMSRRDAITRLYSEIVKRAERSGKGNRISWDTYYDLVKWLPITKEDFIKTAERAGVRIA